jgi:hypothetical protein
MLEIEILLVVVYSRIHQYIHSKQYKYINGIIIVDKHKYEINSKECISMRYAIRSTEYIQYTVLAGG